jgi:hypothetical protein
VVRIFNLLAVEWSQAGRSLRCSPDGRYLDNTARISEMRDRAFVEAREQLPDLKGHFFGSRPFIDQQL